MNVVSLNNVSLDGNVIRKGGSSSEGGNQGILIVESVDRLDTNASVGSLAVVAQQSGIGKIDLNNIHTLTEEDLDANTMELLNVEKFTPVSSVNLLTPTDLTNLIPSIILFLPKTFSGTNLNALVFGVIPENDFYRVVFQYQDFTGQGSIEPGEYIIGVISDNIYTIDQSVASILESVLNSDEWVICGSEDISNISGAGIPPEQIEVLNRFFEFRGGVPANANLYIKKDQWGAVVPTKMSQLEQDVKFDTEPEIELITLTNSLNAEYFAFTADECALLRAAYEANKTILFKKSNLRWAQGWILPNIMITLGEIIQMFISYYIGNLYVELTVQYNPINSTATTTINKRLDISILPADGSTVASTTYVDEVIANAITTTLNTPV